MNDPVARACLLVLAVWLPYAALLVARTVRGGARPGRVMAHYAFATPGVTAGILGLLSWHDRYGLALAFMTFVPTVAFEDAVIERWCGRRSAR